MKFGAQINRSKLLDNVGNAISFSQTQMVFWKDWKR